MVEFPEYLFKYFNPEKIEFINSENNGAEQYKNGLIFVLETDDRKECVISLFHEVLHFHPHFISYTGGLSQRTLDRSDSIEKEIDDMAYQLYDEREDLVELAEKVIEESKKLYEERLERIEIFRQLQRAELREFLKIRNRRRYGI